MQHNAKLKIESIMIIVNGQIQSTISVLDRGFQYGDGFFTTAMLVNKSITSEQLEPKHSDAEPPANLQLNQICSSLECVLLEKHIERLQLTAEKLKFPAVDWLKLNAEITYALNQFAEVVRTNNLQLEDYYVLKIILTRGVGGRGYSSQGSTAANRIISISPYPTHYRDWQKNGIVMHTSQVKLGKNPLLAGLKHLNRLEQVLIRQEMDEQNWQDVIVCDYDGFIVEASAANIFWRKGNIIYTPDLSGSGVAGILRAQIIDSIQASKTPFSLSIVKEKLTTLADAEELFLTNGLMPIIPVNQITLAQNTISPATDLTQNHYQFAKTARLASQFFYQQFKRLYLNQTST